MRLDHLLSKEDEVKSWVYYLVVKNNKIFPVAMRPWDTPVPIPNTMVKTRAADNTWLETAREDRRLPDSFFRN